MARLFDIFADNAEVLVVGAVLFVFLVLFFIFISIQSRSSRRLLEEMKQSLVETQKQALSSVSELLSERLIEYADTTLLERVSKCYEQLVDRELLPSVNDAARKVAELAEAVSEHEKTGLKLLADELASLFAERLDQYVEYQQKAVSDLKDNTVFFSQELARITATLNTLSNMFSNALSQINSSFEAVSQTSEQLGDKVLEFGQIMDASSRSLADMQSLIAEQVQLASQLTETVRQTRQDADAAAGLLEAQSEKTAEMLREAVQAMQQNSEDAAQKLFERLLSTLSESSGVITDSVSRLTEIALSIEKASYSFSEGLSSVYKAFGSELNDNLSRISKSIVDVVNAEYHKIAAGAEGFSAMFQESLGNLRSEIDTHVQQLTLITQELSRTVSMLKDDMHSSASRFELGMEKSISAALEQMDASLADILSRLVSVTVNIQQAADALPAALNALNKKE